VIHAYCLPDTVTKMENNYIENIKEINFYCPNCFSENVPENLLIGMTTKETTSITSRNPSTAIMKDLLNKLTVQNTFMQTQIEKLHGKFDQIMSNKNFSNPSKIMPKFQLNAFEHDLVSKHWIVARLFDYKSYMVNHFEEGSYDENQEKLVRGYLSLQMAKTY